MNSIEILSKLVAFETISGGSTRAIEAFVQQISESSADEMVVAPVPGLDQRNLAFRFGPPHPGGVALSGHMDVVPVAGQGWTHTPFSLTRVDDRLFGRGSCDMKGFLASMLASVPQLAGASLKRPIWLLFSCDEEVGCLGLPYLLDALGPFGRQIDQVIVGEPTQMSVVNRHSGGYVETVVVDGVAAHSSEPWNGISAIHHVLDVSNKLLQLAGDHQSDVPIETRDVQINLAQISGGTSNNIVADRAELVWSLRSSCDFNPSDLIKKAHRIYERTDATMKSEFPSAGISYRKDLEIPPFQACDDSRAVEMCLRLTGETAPEGMKFGTEAGVFKQFGYDTVVCGPGSIAQAHRPDEWISVEQLKKCERFISDIISFQSH